MDINGITPPAQNSTINPYQMAQIKKSAEDFEAMFASEMFSHMFSGIETDPMFGGGKGEEIFRGMMIQQYGKSLAHSGRGLGVAAHVQQAKIQMQENANRNK